MPPAPTFAFFLPFFELELESFPGVLALEVDLEEEEGEAGFCISTGENTILCSVVPRREIRLADGSELPVHSQERVGGVWGVMT